MPLRLLAAVVAVLLLGCAPAEEEPGSDAPSPTPRSTTAGPTALPENTPAATPTPSEGVAGSATEVLPEDRWTRRAPAPVALSEVAAAAFGGALWIAGGLTADGEATEAVLTYDPRFDLWQQGPPLPRPVHHAALVATGDAVYLLGGYVGSGFDEPTDAVVMLDAATGRWVDGPPLPGPRAAGAAAWDGSRLVYGGGVGPSGAVGDVWALEEGRWEPVGELAEAREHLAGASDGQGRVWFLGGRTGGLDTNRAGVDLVEGGEVRPLGDLPTARGGVAGLHLPGVGACALGGEGVDGTFAAVECMDADGAVTALPPLQEGRHGLGAVVVEGAAYAALGGSEPGLAVSDVLEVLPAAR